MYLAILHQNFSQVLHRLESFVSSCQTLAKGIQKLHYPVKKSLFSNTCTAYPMKHRDALNYK
jgi:hypothetical protein